MTAFKAGASAPLWRTAVGCTAGLLLAATMCGVAGASGTAKLTGSYTVMVISNSLAGPQLPDPSTGCRWCGSGSKGSQRVRWRQRSSHRDSAL